MEPPHQDWNFSFPLNRTHHIMLLQRSVRWDFLLFSVSIMLCLHASFGFADFNMKTSIGPLPGQTKRNLRLWPWIILRGKQWKWDIPLIARVPRNSKVKLSPAASTTLCVTWIWPANPLCSCKNDAHKPNVRYTNHLNHEWSLTQPTIRAATLTASPLEQMSTRLLPC